MRLRKALPDLPNLITEALGAQQIEKRKHAILYFEAAASGSASAATPMAASAVSPALPRPLSESTSSTELRPPAPPAVAPPAALQDPPVLGLAYAPPSIHNYGAYQGVIVPPATSDVGAKSLPVVIFFPPAGGFQEATRRQHGKAEIESLI